MSFYNAHKEAILHAARIVIIAGISSAIAAAIQQLQAIPVSGNYYFVVPVVTAVLAGIEKDLRSTPPDQSPMPPQK